jgi:hypothetical protein
MPCKDILKWADKVQARINVLDQAAATEAKQRAAIKQIITGLAKSLESVGLSAEIGYTSPVGASAKIAIKPRHVETVAGGFDVWDGWKKYTEAGGQVPSKAQTRALLVKLRKIALEQYANCHEAEGWTGSITATFSERLSNTYTESGANTENTDEVVYEEIHRWTLTGVSDGSEEQSYEATWDFTASLKEGDFYRKSLTNPAWDRSTIKPTTLTLSAPSRVEVFVTDKKYEVACGTGTNVFPNEFSYATRMTDSGGSDSTLKTKLDVLEQLVTVKGTLGAGTSISGTKSRTTKWSNFVLPGTEGSSHRLKTEWSLQQTLVN